MYIISKHFDLKVERMPMDGAKKNFTTMPANNGIHLRVLIIQLSNTFIYENSNCVNLNWRACPRVEMVWYKTLDPHLP